MDWHETFKSWSKPPSDTEEAKASTAAEMINKAVRDTQILANRTFSVYPTGSYRNNTNIKLGSDVDIALVLTEAFFYTVPPGRSPAEFGLTGSATYGLTEFRNDVGRALRQQFGADVTLGTKTFDIKANASRLPADATPFLAHRAYTGARNPDGSWQYHEGVELRPTDDPNRRIINWHHQHYAIGVERNHATKKRFKRVTRILKQLREDMSVRGTSDSKAAADPAASFLIECLVFNAPDRCFNRQEGTYYDDVKEVIRDIYNRTQTDASSAEMLEVNQIKPLFGAHQGWTRQQANQFLLRAWHHVGFT